MTDSIANLKSQLQHLQSLLDSGVLEQAAYAQAKAVLEQRILAVVLSGPAEYAVPWCLASPLP